MVRMRSAGLLLAVAAGCSSVKPGQSFMQNCHSAAYQGGAGSARAQRSTMLPWLRSDLAMRRRLLGAVGAGQPKVLKEELARFLVEGEQLGRRLMQNELLRLPLGTLDPLYGLYAGDFPTQLDLAASARRRRLSQRYDKQSKAALADQRRWVTSQTAASVLVERANAILQSFQPAVQHADRSTQETFTMSWTSLAQSCRDGYRKNMRNWGPKTSFKRTMEWSPDAARSERVRDTLAKALPEDLLAYYAPVIVQEVADDPSYAPEADRIGEVTVALNWLGKPYVKIDTTKPTVYGYWIRRYIHGAERYQLVYTVWYPERPAMVAFDADAGQVDGVVVRLTLDRQNQPAIYETMSTCGRFHQVYPAERLEQMARSEYGPPFHGQRFALADRLPDPHVGPVIRMVVPDVPSGPGPASQPAHRARRAALYCSAGYHLCEAIRDWDGVQASADVATSRRYRLAPYRQLETIKILGDYYSMFGPDGLVPGAGRTLGVHMMPLGVLSAGQPRQRGTQVIHFDETDFDDPGLLDRYLRLPSGF